MKEIVLKENSEEIRKQLEEAGFDVCICTGFEDSIWLNYYNYRVHGVGYPVTYPDENSTPEKECEEFLRLGKETIEVCENVGEFIRKCSELLASRK